MAHPKRRHSNQRTRKRRTNDRRKLAAINTYACPKCGAQKLPHRVCANCGHYGRRKVLDVA